MRTWERAVSPTLCGVCGIVLAEGVPIQRIQFTGIKRRLSRCAGCADSEVPPNLPTYTRHHETTKPMQPLSKVIATADKWMPYKG